MVIWVTGLSASGKTTLCQALWRLLKADLPQLVLLDGDAVREIFANDLTYKEEDRTIQIQRLQRLAKELSSQGLVVLVAALYAHPDLLAWNRANIPDYFEVYIEAPLSLVRQRDPKGLYAKAARGEMPDVVGLDIPWYAPMRPDFLVRAQNGEPASTVAHHIARQAGLLCTDVVDLGKTV
jgi:adenylyl-sulfate kinase